MKFILFTGTLGACLLGVATVASAGLPQSPYPPPTVASSAVLPPTSVPGKEYSNHWDHSMAAGFPADPLQNIAWDGAGNAWDTFDYGDSGEVDALANIRDAYYWDVVNDRVPLLNSFESPVFGESDDIYYQKPGVDINGVWAHGNINPPPGSDINTPRPPDDVDGLEVWGPEVFADPPGGVGDDSDMYSLMGDPGGTAVWQFRPGVGSFAYITSVQIANAIDRPDLVGEIDLDAMMIFDAAGDDYFAVNDSIMFSIRAIGGAFDGGEIWVWTRGAPAAFLFHGGEVWNTPHTVGPDYLVGTEEVNALEALPEPTTLGLLGLGGLALLRRRRG